jgi:enoyl-CoA hydratase/carnithine racemase
MIRQDRAEGLWTVTIDRPDKANSLTAVMLEELTEIAEAASEARALILTGTGRVFSAGADLGEARTGLATDSVWERLSGTIAALPCLTIAALNGTLAGGAFGMVLACDLRVAAPKAKFFYPVMKLGFLPQPSDPGRLRALVGPARAKLILMAGAHLSADEARAVGLVDVIDPDPSGQARVLAEDALDAAPEQCEAIKAMI